MNMKDRGGFLVVLISLLIGASEPMMSERGMTTETAERMKGAIVAEYGQGVEIGMAREEPRRERLTGVDRENFALSCADRLAGMAKMATACGAVDEARDALKAADTLRFMVAGHQIKRRASA